MKATETGGNILPTIDGIGDSARLLTENLDRIGQAARLAAKSIGEAWYQLCCSTYREHFGPLPGSERTSRLRKKRRKLVVKRVRELMLDRPKQGRNV
jgi:hypothetical protein